MINIIKDGLRKIRNYLRSINPLKFTKYDYYFLPPLTNRVPSTCRLHDDVSINSQLVVVYISSRNNYQMLQNEILVNNDFSDFLRNNFNRTSPCTCTLGLILFNK